MSPDSDNGNLLNLTNHTSMHKMRKHVRARGICMFIHGPSICKLGPDLSVDYESIEVLCTAQKWSFPLRISPVNVAKSATADLVIFTHEILTGKLIFCAVMCENN